MTKKSNIKVTILSITWRKALNGGNLKRSVILVGNFVGKHGCILPGLFCS